MQFSIKKIQSQTLGEIFKKTREEAGFDLSKVSKETQINKKYLVALEEGNYSELPSGLYLERFLKKYADFLNLEFEPLWRLFLKEQTIWSKTKFQNKGENSKFIKIISSHSLIDSSKIIKICIGGLFVTFLLGYLGWEVRKIFLPPYLEIISPTDNFITSQSVIEVVGRTEKETQININGQEISSDLNGYFSENVNLQKGLNIIKISSRKKHSKENVAYRRVMVVD